MTKQKLWEFQLANRYHVSDGFVEALTDEVLRACFTRDISARHNQPFIAHIVDTTLRTLERNGVLDIAVCDACMVASSTALQMLPRKPVRHV